MIATINVNGTAYTIAVNKSALDVYFSEIWEAGTTEEGGIASIEEFVRDVMRVYKTWTRETILKYIQGLGIPVHFKNWDLYNLVLGITEEEIDNYFDTLPLANALSNDLQVRQLVALQLFDRKNHCSEDLDHKLIKEALKVKGE